MESIIVDKKAFYIICPFHIGDILISGCLAHALKRPEGKRTTKIVALQYLSKLKAHFEDVSEIIYISQEDMDEVRKYIILSGKYQSDDYFYGHFRVDSKNQMIWSNELDFLQRYKYDIYSLPLDVNLRRPTFESISKDDIAKLNDKYVLDKEHTVVLTPYSYSSQMLSMQFWSALANKLQELGFLLYTNVGNAAKEQPVNGTLPMQTSFSELFYVADKVKCFVGMRSGINDFLAFTNAEALAVHHIYAWHDDLHRIFPESNAQTIYCSEPILAPLNDYLSKLIQTCSLDISINMSIKFKYIDSKICYTLNDLFNAILNYVAERR